MAECPVKKRHYFNIWQKFETIVKRHIKKDKANEHAYRLKFDHTLRVTNISKKIGEEIGLDDCGINIARIIGLLHDIGRFEQFAQYRTFADSQSENHAALGAKIIAREHILNPIPYPYNEIIHFAVKYHNLITLKETGDAKYDLHLKLCRDADKIDILNVFLLEDHSKDGVDEVIDLGLPDNGDISPKVYDALLQHQTASYRDIRSITDFRLLKLAWIFDINFDASYRMIQERGYLDILRQILPDSDEITKIFDEIDLFVAERFVKSPNLQV